MLVGFMVVRHVSFHFLIDSPVLFPVLFILFRLPFLISLLVLFARPRAFFATLIRVMPFFVYSLAVIFLLRFFARFLLVPVSALLRYCLRFFLLVWFLFFLPVLLGFRPFPCCSSWFCLYSLFPLSLSLCMPMFVYMLLPIAFKLFSLFSVLDTSLFLIMRFRGVGFIVFGLVFLWLLWLGIFTSIFLCVC